MQDKCAISVSHGFNLSYILAYKSSYNLTQNFFNIKNIKAFCWNIIFIISAFNFIIVFLKWKTIFVSY